MSVSADKSEIKQKYAFLAKNKLANPYTQLLFLKQAYINDPKDFQILNTLAHKYYELRFYLQAIELCDKALIELQNARVEPTNMQNLYLLRAYSKLYSNQLDGIQAEFNKIRSLMMQSKSNDPEKIKQIDLALQKEIPDIKNNPKIKSDQEKTDEALKVRDMLENYELPRTADSKVYLLSGQWFEKWKKHVKYSQVIKQENEHVNFMEEEIESYLGPIDQSDIIDQVAQLIDPEEREFHTNVVIKMNLQENRDFLIISPELWEFLSSKYGGGLPIPRFTVWRTDDQLDVQIEIWLQQVNVMVYSIETSQKKIVEKRDLDKIFISKKKTIFELDDKLQRIYSDLLKSVNPKHRLWKLDPLFEIAQLFPVNQNQKVKMPGNLLEPQTKVEDSEISAEDVVVLEYKWMPGATWTFTNELLDSSKKENQASSMIQTNSSNSGKLNRSDESEELIKHFDITKKQFSSSSKKGLTGLQNLGNTCFMNSAIQCLSNTFDLTEYFLSNTFVRDLNTKNPIGTGGRLAVFYAELLKEMWFGSQSYVSPWDLKKTIGRVASQFYGYGQQDSQELLSYLLDGLHEDLNRVKVKPTVETIESNDRDDETVSNLSWENHLRRNQSRIQELMHGQFRSTIVCPDCRRISITFDPYMMLSLPIPQIEYSKFFLYFVSENPKQLPAKVTFNIPKNTSASDIKNQLATMVKVKESSIVMALLKEHKLVEMVGENADAYYLKEHSGIPFAYQISMYDEDKMTNENEKQFLVKVLVSAEPKSFYETEKVISYTRLITADTSVTFQELHLKVYEKMRHHILSHYTKSQKKCNINIEDKSPQKIKAEYDELFSDENEANWVYKLHLTNSSKEDPKTGKKPNCDICEKKCKSCVLPNENKRLLDYCNKMNVIISDIVLDCKITKPTKIENLLLNQCQEHSSGDSSENSNKEYNIYDCMKMFTKKERLEKENAWYCSKCKQHKQATKTMEIFKAPEILIIHLKRFKTSKVSSFGSFYFASGSQKISALVDFPIQGLDLTQYVLGKSSESKVYDLFAVSNHYGGLGGGHYTAYCKNYYEKRWFEFNDSRVSPTSEKEVVNSAAYVLFYKRRHN